MYNLTPNQKELLRWIVAKVREGVLGEEFHTCYEATQYVVLLRGQVPTWGRGSAANSSVLKPGALPGGSLSALEALVEAKCLRETRNALPQEMDMRVFSLTAIGQKAVETNFADVPAPQQPPAYTFNTAVHGGAGIQIGTSNQMLNSSLEALVHVLDNATGSPDEKAMAKTILAHAFAHPTVKTVLGDLATKAIEALKK